MSGVNGYLIADKPFKKGLSLLCACLLSFWLLQSGCSSNTDSVSEGSQNIDSVLLAGQKTKKLESPEMLLAQPLNIFIPRGSAAEALTANSKLTSTDLNSKALSILNTPPGKTTTTVKSAFDAVTVRGILYLPQHPSAILAMGKETEFVHPGSLVNNALKVLAVRSDSVVLQDITSAKKTQKIFTLDSIRDFDNKKHAGPGEAPHEVKKAQHDIKLSENDTTPGTTTKSDDSPASRTKEEIKHLIDQLQSSDTTKDTSHNSLITNPNLPLKEELETP